MSILRVSDFRLAKSSSLCHSPECAREGVELNSLVGQEFEIQGVRFVGVEACKPCYWMASALGPGAEAWLQGRGGLRARILTDDILPCAE